MSDCILRHFIVCDDVREETHGKSTYVGVYFDDLIVPSFPAVINQIAFVASVKLMKDNPRVAFRIIDESTNNSVFDFDQVIPQPSGTIANFNIRSRLFLSKPAKFIFFFGAEPNREQITEFIVRAPKDETERQTIEALNNIIKLQTSMEKPAPEK